MNLLLSNLPLYVGVFFLSSAEPPEAENAERYIKNRAYSFCLSDLSAERKVLFFLTRRGHVISPRQIEQTEEAVRTAPTH